MIMSLRISTLNFGAGSGLTWVSSPLSPRAGGNPIFSIVYVPDLEVKGGATYLFPLSSFELATIKLLRSPSLFLLLPPPAIWGE